MYWLHFACMVWPWMVSCGQSGQSYALESVGKKGRRDTDGLKRDIEEWSV